MLGRTKKPIQENVKNSINVYPMCSLSAAKHTWFETMLLGSFKIPPAVYWIFQKLFILEGSDMGVVTFMVHVHKKHGFFIPDVKYLKDPKSFLAYLGLKVNRDYMCLYCNDGCHPFGSLEVVQKHMEAENHCKVHYDDGCDNDRYLIRLLGDALLRYIYDYMYQNILTDRLACMALATDLGFKNTSFRNPPSQLLDVLLDVQVGKDAYKTNSFDK